jgi:hypothetical protein
MIAAVLPHAHRQERPAVRSAGPQTPRRYSVSWSSRFVANRLRGVENETKLPELSAEGPILLEFFASNFVSDGRDSRLFPAV